MKKIYSLLVLSVLPLIISGCNNNVQYIMQNGDRSNNLEEVAENEVNDQDTIIENITERVFSELKKREVEFVVDDSNEKYSSVNVNSDSQSYINDLIGDEKNSTVSTIWFDEEPVGQVEDSELEILSDFIEYSEIDEHEMEYNVYSHTLPLLEKVGAEYKANFDMPSITMRNYWDPLPVELLSHRKANEYEQIIKDYLSLRGIHVRDAGLKQIVRADIDDDGNEEVFISANNLDSQTNDTKFSVVFMRTIATEGDLASLDQSKLNLMENTAGSYQGETIAHYMIEESSDKMYYIPYIMDLDGNGSSEIVISDNHGHNSIYKVEGFDVQKIKD